MKKLYLLSLAIVTLIHVNAQNWTEVQKIISSDLEVNDYYGAAVSVSGNYAIVGAYAEDEDEMGGDSIGWAGSAYIFERDSTGTWNQMQKIVASDRAFNDHFGYSVSISGNIAVVGAIYEAEDAMGGNTLTGAGSAYIFERDSLTGVWSEAQKIVASDRKYNADFGYAVAISGHYLVIGADHENYDEMGGNYISSAGAAYIFEKDSLTGVWSEVQKIVASDRAAGDFFGWATSINNNSIIIGSLNDVDATGGNYMSHAGSAYLFERDSSGTWNEVQKIVASDRAKSDFFSGTVSIRNNYIIVGAPLSDKDAIGGDSLEAAGAAYIFEKDSNGLWNEVRKIVPSDRDVGDGFGVSVSVSNDIAVIGAHGEDDNANGVDSMSKAGSAYIFKRDSTGTWNEVQKIVASDRAENDRFGLRVSIDGDYIVVGGDQEYYFSGDYYSKGGTAYIFELSSPCLNTSSTLSPTVCYSYTSPSGNYTWTTSGTYYDTIPNAAGCDSLITVFLTIVTLDTSVTQSGVMLTANASGATYQWLNCDSNYAAINGETAQSFTATVNGNFAVEVTQIGCVDTSACHSITTISEVWPGDANNDGVADNQDLLNIGIAYNETGPVRPNASLVWIGQPAADWSSQFANGVNTKHADCDGNGIVDSFDVDAINMNFGLTHSKSGGHSGGGLPLFVKFQKDTVQPGDTIIAKIHLGNDSASATDVYGFAFNLDYSATLLKSGSVHADFSNSWIASPPNSISLQKDNTSKLTLGFSRIDHQNITGFGAVANLGFVVKNNAVGSDSVIAAQFSFSEITVISNDETVIPVGEIETTLFIQNESTSISNQAAKEAIAIYPNPASSILYVKGVKMPATFQLYDVLGKKTLTAYLKTGENKIRVANLTEGLYLYKIIGLSKVGKVLIKR